MITCVIIQFSKTQLKLFLMIFLRLFFLYTHQQYQFYLTNVLQDNIFIIYKMSKNTEYIYQLSCMQARKISLLIKVSRLKIQIKEENIDLNPKFILRTNDWELTNQYQIIQYVINQSLIQSKIKEGEEAGENTVVNLGADQGYINARMTEKLFSLRTNLFFDLEHSYSCVLGHTKIKKSSYDALTQKIKKQMGELNQDIDSCPQIFKKSTFYLNILITCQLFLGSNLIFQQKTRKIKCSTLFDMYEKTSSLPEFQEVYGKTNFSSRQYPPEEFLEEDPPKADKKQPISVNFLKIPELSVDSSRNELLYNYFRTVLVQNNAENKRNYFTYYWMVFNELECCLVEIQTIADDTLGFIKDRLKSLTQRLEKNLKHTLDYGILGIYKQKKNDHYYYLGGLICLASRSYEQFLNIISGDNQLKTFGFNKIDSNSQKERKKVQMIWDHSQQNVTYDDVNVCSIIYI